MAEDFVPPSPVLYAPLRALLRLLLGILARMHVEGVERVPIDETLLLCSNHLSMLDPPIFMAYVPQVLSVMAAEKYAAPLNPLGWPLRLVDVIFVRRGEVDRQALKAVLQRLGAGRSVGLAPEGTRSHTGGLIPGKEGAAYIAQKSGVRILPVAVWGAERLLPSLLRLRRADVYIRIGEPFALQLDPTLPRGAQLVEGTGQIMRAIARLLPPEYRGVYAGEVAEEMAPPSLQLEPAGATLPSDGSSSEVRRPAGSKRLR